MLNTKWGKAKIDSLGYYRITSWKEGNNMGLLHRLIWEDFYGCKVPKGYVVHHKNGDKLCNCILNLQLMRNSEHSKLHNKGKILSEEHKQKISESLTGRTISDETKLKISKAHSGKILSEEHCKKLSESHKGKPLSEENKTNICITKNTTGYLNVCKQKRKTCKQGFTWCYQYYEDGKHKSITSVDINKLKQKVKNKGLKWMVL